jgi:phospholipid transport system substrate-binding protein
MEIKHGGKVYVVVYRMRRGKEETWRMQNLVVEGINIGLNYKSQFTAAMKDPQWGGDMDAVIDAWTRVIESEESEESEEPEQTQVSDEESGTAKDDDASTPVSSTTAAD